MGRGISITVKYGKGYEETWARFFGTATEVRTDLCSYFGLTEEQGDQFSLNELVIKCTEIAHGVGLVGTVLGGQIQPNGNGPSGDHGPPWNEPSPSTGGGDPWAGVGNNQSSEPADPLQVHYDAVKRATTTDELKLYWADNQAAFADEQLMAAYKAKGKALSQAAAS